MAAADPFAGLTPGPLVQPGALEGTDLGVEPLTTVEGSTEEPPAPTVPVALDADPLQNDQWTPPAVVEGNLGGDMGAGDPNIPPPPLAEAPSQPPVSSPTPEEVAAAEQLDAEFAAAMARDDGGESADPIQAAEAQATPVAAAEAASSGSSVSVEDAAPAAPRRRRRKAADEPEADADGKTEYLCFDEGLLDNGEPFFWVVHTCRVAKKEDAFVEAYRAAGEPADGVRRRCVPAGWWEPRTVGVKLIPREPIRKVVVE